MPLCLAPPGVPRGGQGTSPQQSPGQWLSMPGSSSQQHLTRGTVHRLPGIGSSEVCGLSSRGHHLQVAIASPRCHLEGRTVDPGGCSVAGVSWLLFSLGEQRRVLRGLGKHSLLGGCRKESRAGRTGPRASGGPTWVGSRMCGGRTPWTEAWGSRGLGRACVHTVPGGGASWCPSLGRRVSPVCRGEGAAWILPRTRVQAKVEKARREYRALRPTDPTKALSWSQLDPESFRTLAWGLLPRWPLTSPPPPPGTRRPKGQGLQSSRSPRLVCVLRQRSSYFGAPSANG